MISICATKAHLRCASCLAWKWAHHNCRHNRTHFRSASESGSRDTSGSDGAQRTRIPTAHEFSSTAPLHRIQGANGEIGRFSDGLFQADRWEQRSRPLYEGLPSKSDRSNQAKDEFRRISLNRKNLARSTSLPFSGMSVPVIYVF